MAVCRRRKRPRRHPEEGEGTTDTYQPSLRDSLHPVLGRLAAVDTPASSQPCVQPASISSTGDGLELQLGSVQAGLATAPEAVQVRHAGSRAVPHCSNRRVFAGARAAQSAVCWQLLSTRHAGSGSVAMATSTCSEHRLATPNRPAAQVQAFVAAAEPVHTIWDAADALLQRLTTGRWARKALLALLPAEHLLRGELLLLRRSTL